MAELLGGHGASLGGGGLHQTFLDEDPLQGLSTVVALLDNVGPEDAVLVLLSLLGLVLNLL